MAGGNGSRFWPITRDDLPKQFVDFTGEKTFIRRTWERFSSIFPADHILVVTMDRYAGRVREQIPELLPENLLLEPYSRSTAPCLTYASLSVLNRDPDAVILATPSDLVIEDNDQFRSTVENALDYASGHDVLMTLGIVPTSPDVNFGYIQVKSAHSSTKGPFQVKTFTEKPDRALAEVFCKSGEFFWNSGMYFCRASVLRDQIARFVPEVYSLFKDMSEVIGTPSERACVERAYMDCPKVSLDYGVMEKTDCAWLYPAMFGWSDIGSWDSLYRFLPRKDGEGNAVNTPSISEGNTGCIMVSMNRKKLMAVKGLKDYLVIDTDDALMICPRKDKDVKEFLSDIGMPQYEPYR